MPSTNRKRFDFTGPDVDHQCFGGFRVALGEAPTIAVLQGLFGDLYLQWRGNPEYLFVSKEDVEALTEECAKGPSVPCSPASEDSPAIHSVYARKIVGLCNQVTGRMVHIVSLPGLEQGSVIVGFLK